MFNFYTPMYVVTALISSNNVALNAGNPFIDDVDTPGADFQAIDYTNGNSFVKGSTTLLWMRNDTVAETAVVTIESQIVGVPDLIVSLAPTKQVLIGNFNKMAANGAAIPMTYSGITGAGVTVAVVDVG